MKEQPPKTVQVTIHVHNGQLVAACPDPCVVAPGDTIVWKTCDPNDTHLVHIGNFRESATDKPHDPMDKPDYDVSPQTEAKGQVTAGAAKMKYRYTVKLVHPPSAIAHASEYVKNLALVGQASATAEHVGVHVTAKTAGDPALVPHLVEMFGSETKLLGFTKYMMLSYSDQEMDPEVEVGGGTGG